MNLSLKNKKKIFCPVIISIFFFLITTSHVFGATLDFSKAFEKYAKGDEIRIDVIVGSEVSINAISANILFSNDVLYLFSIEKNSSVIDLWVKEPYYSNGVGSIYFEGIILDGFKGDSRNVVTLIFKAKKDGKAILQFSQASVLANDGTGKDLLDFKGISNFTVGKLNQTSKDNMIVQDSFCDKFVKVYKEIINKIYKLEESKNLPRNSIFVISIIILLITFYLIKKFLSTPLITKNKNE